jgi:hypothetical protein
MNNSLEKLIQEAESSLKTRPSLHQESKSRFIKSSTSTNKLKLQQQKNRYLYSQWKLAIAMKQLLSTVQKQESTTNDQQVHHYHHIHHHHYHHIYVDNTIAQEVIHKEPTNISTSSISSFFKYALDIVGGFIPSLSSNSSKLPKSVKYRTIFLSSLLILQRYNKRNLWIRRGQYLMHAWKSRRFYLYTHWVQKAHLLHFMLQIFASSSSSSASSKRHLF